MTKTLNMKKLLLVLSLSPILSNCIKIQNENVTSATENPKENPTYSVLENQNSQSLRMESTTPIAATLPSKLPLERPLRNENMDKSLKVLNQVKNQQLKNLSGDEISKIHQQMYNNKHQQALNNLNNYKNATMRNNAQDQQVAKTEPEIHRTTNKRAPDRGRGEEQEESSARGADFIPSPELSSLYTDDNNIRDHFSPNNVYRRPVKHDAHYPPSPMVTFPESNVDTRWLGASQIKRPEYEALRQLPIPGSYEGRKTQWISEGPKEMSPWFDKFPPGVGGLNKINEDEIKQFKGYWKWIPQDDYKGSNKNDEYDTKVVLPIHYPEQELGPFSKPQTTRDRPYNFESQETPVSFFQHSNPSPENIKSDSLVWTTSESPHLATTELNSKEIVILNERHKHLLDHKFKSPHFKKIFHVLAAAIPIGLLISALTPKVVFVHPNSTMPPFVNRPPGFPGPAPIYPNLQNPPNLNLQPQNLPLGGLNTNNFPNINRQRSVDDRPTSPNDFLKNPLMEFITSLESKFKWPGASSELNTDLENGECEDRIFCEIAVAGSNPNSEELYKMLWKVANETSREKAEKSGMGELFKAIRKKSCKALDCAQAKN